MKSHPRKPHRFRQDTSIYFLTFCTFYRLPILHLTGIPEFLIEELNYCEHKIRKLIAYTIMPDHIHLMIEVEDADSVSIFLRDYKTYSSKGIKKILNECSRRLSAVDPANLSTPTDSRLLLPGRIWQPGTMDHCIRNGWESNDYDNHISYIFYNSYKHLGITPKDFAHHNFMEFVERKEFDENFCAMEEIMMKNFEIYE